MGTAQFFPSIMVRNALQCFEIVSENPSLPKGPLVPQLRQKILILYLHTPDLNSHVVAWSIYDGNRRTKAYDR